MDQGHHFERVVMQAVKETMPLANPLPQNLMLPLQPFAADKGRTVPRRQFADEP